MSEERRGSSIWDGLPEEWATGGQTDQPKDAPQDERKNMPTPPIPDPTPQAQDAPEETAQSGAESAGPAQEEEPVPEKRGWRSGRKQKKIDKQRYKDFEKREEENRHNGSERAQKAREEERKGNKRDFVILGVAAAVIVLGIAAAIFFVTGRGNQKIYTLIDEGNFSTAYHAIAEQYEKGKNVDSVVYTFADSCVEQEQYKRAVASLEMLSEDAVNHADFFEELVEKLLSHGKTNRAAEVIDFMYERGGALTEAADQLLETYDGF